VSCLKESPQHRQNRGLLLVGEHGAWTRNLKLTVVGRRDSTRDAKDKLRTSWGKIRR